MLKRIEGVYKSDVLCSNFQELFDYSTNLPGRFAIHHNFITLVGERKSLFRRYWIVGEEVERPIYKTDFKIEKGKGIFYLPIDRIHNNIIIPFSRLQNQPATSTATAYVFHTPTNSNFWHFSIKWIDDQGNEIRPSNAAWKNLVTASMRAVLLEMIETTPAENPELDEHDYK